MSNVLTFDEIRLERIADMTLWGHGILRDEGIGGPIESAGAGFMMRNFLVEALMLLGESAGLELEEPVFESVPVLSSERRERAGYVVEPGTICGHDRQVTANVRGGGRLVSVWRGRFDSGARRDGRLGAGRRGGRPGVRDDRPRRPVPRHVPADRRSRDGRRAARSGPCRRACTRSTSWACARSSASRPRSRSSIDEVARGQCRDEPARVEGGLRRVDARPARPAPRGRRRSRPRSR